MRQSWFLLLALVAGCSALPVISLDQDAGPAAQHVTPIGPALAEAGAAGDAGSSDASLALPDADTTSTWCDTIVPTPIFCDDFDRGELGARWDFFQKSPPGTAELDPTEKRSAPNALAIVTPEVDDTAFGSILLRKSIATSSSHLIFDFDVFADQADESGTLAIATLDLSTDHLLTLYLRDDDPNTPGPSLVEIVPGGAVVARHPLSQIPAPGKWTRVELEVYAAQGKLTMRYDGVPIMEVAIAVAVTDKPTIRIGALVQGAATSYTFRFDNVSLAVTP